MAAHVAAPPFVARVLPAAEWGKLVGRVPYDLAAQHPDHTIVVVVEDAEGLVVASWLALNIVHLEGLYVAPEGRGHPAIAKTLVLGMTEQLKLANIPAVVTIVQDDAVREMADKLGFTHIPGTLHQLTL